MIHLDDLPAKIYTPSKGFGDFPDVFTSFRKSTELGGAESTHQVRRPRMLEAGLKLPVVEAVLNWNGSEIPDKVQKGRSCLASWVSIAFCY